MCTGLPVGKPVCLCTALGETRVGNGKNRKGAVGLEERGWGMLVEKGRRSRVGLELDSVEFQSRSTP